MEIKTNSDFNKIQINYSQDKTADNKIIKQGILVSIREDSVEKAYRLFQDLMRKIEGKSEEKPKKRIKKEKEESNRKPEGIETPTCECGHPMILKSGRWGSFWSCSTYPLCRLTKPFVSEEEKKRLESVPCDQDLIDIPF